MREQHEATGHAQYRPWCEWCISGKGQANPHRGAPKSECPEINLDFGYETSHEHSAPCIYGRETHYGSYCGTMLPSKTATNYAVAYLTGWIRSLGYRKIIQQSDNEPSLLKLLEKVAEQLPTVEIVVRTSPVGDSQANGAAENAVREGKKQGRVLRNHLESKLGQRLPHDRHVLAWIPRHGMNCINRYRMGADGRSSEHRRTGRRWNRPTVVFGEICMYRPVRTKQVDKQSTEKMQKGAFVGHHERSGTLLFLTPGGGMARGTGVHRLPEAERWNYDYVCACTGLPWDPKATYPALVIPVAPGSVAGQAPLISGGVVAAVPLRNFSVLARDVQKWGPSAGCAACTEIVMTGKVTGRTTVHDAACRDRIMKLYQAETDDLEVMHRWQVWQGRLKTVPKAPANEAGESSGATSAAPTAPAAPTATTVPTTTRVPPAEADVEMTGAAPLLTQGRVRAAVSMDERQEDVRPANRPRTGTITEPQGEKRKAEDEIDRERVAEAPQSPDQHIDADVQLVIDPPSAAAPSSTAPAPATPAAIADPMDEAATLDICCLSAEKERFIPKVKCKLQASFDHYGITTNGAELDAMARYLTELNAVDVAEIFTPPRLTEKCGSFGLRPGFAIDLTTKRPDGEYWDLSRAEDRRQLEELQAAEQPKLLTGSPPCTDFSILLHLRHDRDEIEARKAGNGRVHLETAVAAYWRQLASGNHFLHEHPTSASSWREPVIEALAADPRVYKVRGPMCAWELLGKGGDYVRKETTWLTSSSELAATLKRTCANVRAGVEMHRHVHLTGNTAAAAAVYPPKLVTAILKALRRQLRAEGDSYTLAAYDAGPSPDQREWWDDNPMADETTDRYWDDLNGGWLDPQKAKAARQEELQWMEYRKVFRKVPEAWAKQRKLKKLSLKWIDTYKSDGRYRSRLVVREIKKAKPLHDRLKPEDVFSAMPPVESLKMLVSIMQTEQTDASGAALAMAKWDISRAHFYGKSQRDVICSLPDELWEEGMVAHLLKTMYGTEDASRIWGDTWPKELEQHGLDIGKSCRALFSGPDHRGFCYGDDFCVVASEANLDKFGTWLEAAFDLRREATIGMAAHLGTELYILNRVVRIDRPNLTIEIEADQKHVQTLLRELGLENAKAAPTPAVKLTPAAYDRREQSEPLSRDGALQYRSGVMRCKYLDQDRIDIAETVKALAQAMANPREGHLTELKRLARYLKGQPRHVVRYGRQSVREAHLKTHVDSDWAGQNTKRKSTSGMIIQRGAHLLRHTSTVQSTQALSSAEAEYYALVRGASYTLGVRSHFRDLGIDLEIDICTDSSSGKAFAARRGLGKMRHIETRYLWVQEHLALKTFRLHKVLGTENPADVLTKPQTEGTMRQVCNALGEFEA